MGTVRHDNSTGYRFRRRKPRSAKRLTSIWGLGPRHAAALTEIGIPDCKALVASEPDVLAERLREVGVGVSVAQIQQWRAHAESYLSRAPIFFGPPPPVGDRYLALDLEYYTFKGHVWLIGLLIVQGARQQHVALWSDNAEQERASIQALQQVLAAFPGLPVVTWAGTGADLPQLEGAAERHGVTGSFAGLIDRHVDLFACARASVRLPLPELSLSALAAYLRLPKTSPIRNGMEAQVQFEIYQGLRDPALRATRKAELLAYNHDDLTALNGVLGVMLDPGRLGANRRSIARG